MCIRDRSYQAGNTEVDFDLYEEVRAKMTFSDIPNELKFKPVSYTHLRAHETVLDLVCRLLLEKKKHTHNKSNKTQQTIHTDIRRSTYTHSNISHMDTRS